MPLSPEYRAYIRSDAWRAKRARILARDGHKCWWCGGRRRLQVHHLTYARLGNERDADLLTLCAGCHAWVTAATRFWRWLWKK